MLAGSYLNKHFHILKDPKPWNGSAMIVRALLTTCTRQFVKSVVGMGTKLGVLGLRVKYQTGPRIQRDWN